MVHKLLSISLAFIIPILIASCSNETANNKAGAADSSNTAQRNVSSFTANPDSTILNFLRWYTKNINRLSEINLVTNNGTDDTTKYYSVNFHETENYLGQLKASGFISEEYLKGWRTYFRNADEHFKTNPQNEGPPEGFDYDLVMQSQDVDEDLQKINQAKVVSTSNQGEKVIKQIRFPSGQQLIFALSSENNSWLIDKIENAEK